MEQETKELLQWHPAFYASLQIELAEEAHKLIFENEHPLSNKPMLIDVLIIKKIPKNPFKKILEEFLNNIILLNIKALRII